MHFDCLRRLGDRGVGVFADALLVERAAGGGQDRERGEQSIGGPKTQISHVQDTFDTAACFA